jgi:cell division septation protein DedD
MAANNRRTLELKLGKLGLTLFVGGMSLLLFSMFLLGVLVGQHLDAYPEKYSGGLVDLVRDRFSGLAIAPQQENPPLSDEQKTGKDITSAGEEFDLTFYQVLGNKNKKSSHEGDEGYSADAGALKTEVSGAAAKKERAVGGASPGVGAKKAVPENAIPPRKVDKVALPAQKEVSDASAAAGKSAQPAPLKADKKEKTGAFQVQAAAFRDAGQAKKMAEMLKSIGFNATVVPRDIPDKGRWFRVVAGDFESREKAKQAVSQIAKKIKGAKCIIRQQ